MHGFTTRLPGELNLNYSTGPAAGVTRNRRALLRALAPPRRGRWRLVTLRQRHTDIIQLARGKRSGARTGAFGQGNVLREPDGSVKLAGDAIVSGQPGLLLTVSVADCLPILLADPRRRVVAAVHAGWRGTVQRITEKTVGRMRLEFGCNPSDLVAAVGPGIHRCCYEVGPEVAEALAGQFDYAEKLLRRERPSPSAVHWQQPLFQPQPHQPGENPRPRPALTSPDSARIFFDLVEANRRQLRAAGLPADNIWAAPYCTACRTDRFFSHRAEHGHTGRMMGLIGVRQQGSR